MMGIFFLEGVFFFFLDWTQNLGEALWVLHFISFHFIPFHLISLSHGIFFILLYLLLFFYFIFQDTLSSFTCNV